MVPVVSAALIIVLVLIILGVFYSGHKGRIEFFTKGFDYGFHRNELAALWRLALECQLEDPLSLFVSENAVNQCIKSYIQKTKENGTENSFKVQSFLESLYSFKTRVVLDMDKRRGLESTKSLDVGQNLSVIFKGKGVFRSKVLNNGSELVIMMPLQKDKNNGSFRTLREEEWDKSKISVYLWRKGDAGYAFDTEVFHTGVFRSDKALYLRHSHELTRTQKRQSIRAACEIYGLMFLFKGIDEDSDGEYGDGYKCLIEDVSSDGALFRIGGKGQKDVRVKLQYEISGNLVIMEGVVRAVEYNEKLDQSRLHFECKKIEPAMKNVVLSYVYNTIPEEQKEIQEAIQFAEEDDQQGTAPQEAESPEVEQEYYNNNGEPVQTIGEMVKIEQNKMDESNRTRRRDTDY